MNMQPSAEARVFRTTEELTAIADDWNRLVQDCPENTVSGLDGTNTADWILSLRASLLQQQEVELLCTYRSGSLSGVLPIVAERRPVLGVALTCATNAYSGRSGFVVSQQNGGNVETLLEGCDQVWPDWISLDVDTVVGSPTHHALSRLDWRAVDRSTDPVVSPVFPLPASPTEYWAACSQNTRQNVRKSTNKLKAMGRVEYALLTDVSQVDKMLSEIMLVEQHSWKHGAGTAISRHPEQESFYRAYFPRASERGVLMVALMYLDGVPVAHHFGILRNGVFSCLKHSFDHSLERASPAYALMAFLIDQLIQRGVRAFDFMGRSESFKLRWSHDVREYRQINLRVYRDSLAGRIARELDRLRSLAARVVHRQSAAGEVGLPVPGAKTHA